MAKSTGMSEYELTRLERIKENEKMLEELFPEGAQAFTPKRLPSYNGQRKKRRVTDTNSDCVSEPSNSDEEDGCPRKRKIGGYSLRKVMVYPRRNPTRQARKEGSMSEYSRPVTRSLSSSNSEDLLMDGLEDDQELKKTVYKTIRRRHISTEELPIELDDLPAIASTRHISVVERSSDKIYDRVRGTTCHQCRQKTIDIKTVCHNKNCRGVRGQFCAPCLQNRYGEGLVNCLRDGKWVCPPCRMICNCSFCMPKRGRAPTGILIHHARDAGCDNVHEYLNKTDYDY